ncbi:hypothetical protein Tco_0049079 [Tanacetum coccineum]
MKVWFLRECLYGETGSDDVRVGKAWRAWGVEDCLDRLRLMQKSDAKKHVSLRRMLLEAQVETHERQLVVAFVGMSYVLGCRLEDD